MKKKGGDENGGKQGNIELEYHWIKKKQFTNLHFVV